MLNICLCRICLLFQRISILTCLFEDNWPEAIPLAEFFSIFYTPIRFYDRPHLTICRQLCPFWLWCICRGRELDFKKRCKRNEIFLSLIFMPCNLNLYRQPYLNRLIRRRSRSRCQREHEAKHSQNVPEFLHRSIPLVHMITITTLYVTYCTPDPQAPQVSKGNKQAIPPAFAPHSGAASSFTASPRP